MQEEQGLVMWGPWPGQCITQLPIAMTSVQDLFWQISKSVIQYSWIIWSSFMKGPRIQLGSMVDTSTTLCGHLLTCCAKHIRRNWPPKVAYMLLCKLKPTYSSKFVISVKCFPALLAGKGTEKTPYTWEFELLWVTTSASNTWKL